MTEFKLPELGENIDQGDLVRLMIAPGASVTEGQPVMELETDKAVVEVPSSVTGTVKEIRVKEGEKIKVGQVIFTVENGAGAEAKRGELSPRRKQQTCAANPESAAPKDNYRTPEAPAAPQTGCQRALPGFRIQAARTGREHRFRATWCG